MAEDLNLKTTLSSDADTTGATEMSSGLTGVGVAAEEVKTQVEALMEAFVGLFALSEVISFFKDAAEAAYDHEKALRAVAQAALVFGGNMDDAKQRADQFTSALSLQTGVVKTDLLEAYGKVYIATGQATEAEKEITLAANLAAVRHLDVATALRLVEAAATGVPGRFDRIVGGVTEGTTAMEKHENMTRRLISAYGDVSKVLNDQAAAQDRSARKWDEFKETIGGPVLAAFNGLKHGAVEISTWVVKATAELLEWFHVLGQSAGNLGQFMVEVWKGPAAAFAAFKDRGVEIDKQHIETIKALEADSVAAYLGGEKKKTVALVTELDFRGKKEKEAADKYLLNATSDMDAELRHRDAVEALLDKDTVEGVNKRLKEAQREEKEKEKLDHEYQQRWAAIGKENLAQSNEQYKMEFSQYKALKQEELSLEASVVSGGLELAGDAFGIKKELAIAEAVINAAQAILGALSAPWPLDLILPILIGLEAAEQIAKITSTSTPTMPGISAQTLGGAGFDDPTNDAAAYAGGRKWAVDMIGMFSGGASSVSQGWSAGMGAGSNVTNNNTHVTNIHVAGGIPNPSDRESLKQLGRKLAIVMQSDAQRKIAVRG